MYRFPVNEEELEKWISALPSVIKKETVTRHMGICRDHWPVDARMKKSYGRHIPVDPPSIFPGFPRAAAVLREVKKEEETPTAALLEFVDDSFEEEDDLLPWDFDKFAADILCMSFQDVHIFRTEDFIRLVSFESNFLDVNALVTINPDFSIDGFHRKTKVSFSALQPLLGPDLKLTRWSQLDAVVHHVKHFALSLDMELAANVERFQDTFKMIAVDDTSKFELSCVVHE